jgi:hypothetical protein
LNPGSRDLSATMPFVTAAIDLLAPDVELSARPAIGTSRVLGLHSLPAGSSLAALVLSFSQQSPGIDLAGIGMPGCAQYVGLDATALLPVNAAAANLQLSIPNAQPLVGLVLFAQGAAFAPGLNPAGIVASRGLRLVIGL